MKLKGAKQVHYDSGPNMTPLVDVVMVILIFLMLAGSFEQGGWFLVSSMPIKKEGGAAAPPPKPGEIPDEPLMVRVDNSPDGFRVTAGDIRSTGDRDSLKAALEQKRRGLEATGTTPDRVQVILQPGRNVKYNNLITVYEAALRAGFKKVGFATSH